MIVSRNWLQKYFQEPLPKAQELADLFTFHSFEVESVEEKGGDVLLDIKVLPDRAHYALSHLGIAREISYVTGKELVKVDYEAGFPTTKKLEVAIEDERCLRNSKLVIESVTNGQSPQWLREALESVGQRSISLVVDVTNYVMFDIGQPMHAFDLDKLTSKDGKYKITLRKANKEEKIVLLGGKEVVLDEDTLVYADGNDGRALDIAGVKGGAAAEVTEATKNIVLLADNFLPAYIRRASTRYGIKTDAVKRFENGVVSELTMQGLAQAAALIFKESPGATVEGSFDHSTVKSQNSPVKITGAFINSYLGIDVPQQSVTDILKRLECEVQVNGDEYIITAPYYRKDIVVPADVCEEIGRLYGYDKLPSVLPNNGATHEINKKFYYVEKIKNIACDLGYDEASLYALVKKGDFEVAYPLASDKKALRTDLSEGISKALEMNTANAPLLGLASVKIFEIGNTFTSEREATHFAAGVSYAVKKKGQNAADELSNLVSKIAEALGVPLADINEQISGSVVEFDVDALISKLPDPKSFDLDLGAPSAAQFQPYSVYPFAVRDVAVFVPASVVPAQIEEIIRKHANELLVRVDLFDVFTKKNDDGSEKTSYAFRSVLQSKTKTLTEAEITAVVDAIYAELKGKGWEVR